MINVDPKVQRIIDWRESFITLPDNHFFELIRMYLGEIHSPFNKQKLVEQLGAFLRKEENRKTIVNLLSESDILILAAVHYIKEANAEKLAQFFSGTINFAKLYERLLNLEERLLIYRHGDKNMRKTIISLNPMLEDEVLPLLSKKILLPLPVLESRNEIKSFSLTPEKLAAFVNFVAINPTLSKSDGNLKKKDAEKIEEIFGANTATFFQTLLRSFINLSLVKENSNSLKVDFLRLLGFSTLESGIQYAYLCVSSVGILSRSLLVARAKLLLETIASIPATGFTKMSVLRTAFLLYQNSLFQNSTLSDSYPSISGGRFSAILARSQDLSFAKNTFENTQEIDSQNSSKEENPCAIMESLLNCAVEFGLLEEYGTDENGEKVYVKGSALLYKKQKSNEAQKVLNIDAGFNVTVFPGLCFEELVPLMNFMDLKRFDTAAVFEITRKSVMRAFDLGTKVEEIYSLLQKYCAYSIPENLKISLEDWSNSYSSANLYKGYILQVDEKASVIVQNNPTIAPRIFKTISPGTFLLDIQTDEEADSLIKESGLDFIGSIQTAKKQVTGSVFPSFEVSKSVGSALLGGGTAQLSSSALETDGEESYGIPTTDEQRKQHFDMLRGLLEKMAITPEQREGLLLRINRKIILTAQQLNADSVKLEQIEANGMDYQGKVHVAESAITQNMMLEIEYEEKTAKGGVTVIVGTPLSVDKNQIDSTVKMIVEPEHEEKSFSLGQARNVKRIRGSVLR
ncbi:helicase-associated domain-containing protein [Treponema pectinovorum]|uniref:helicase-associated domain-containing protein n=1 Tax=Treponema pectinovorum TaxID=164 RepID=UPI003D8CC5B9